MADETTAGALPGPAGTAGGGNAFAAFSGLRGVTGRQLGLIIGAAALLAAIAAGIMWAERSTYQSLYSGLEDADAAAVVESLKVAGVPYQVDRLSGDIRVPAEQVHEARFTLAAEGLPRGSGSGFEFLRSPDRFGASQFNEQARYRHALEQELARSITSISAVRGARVHLAIPTRTAFARERKPPTASVVLQLQRGRSLDTSETAAITHLVATSIPGMTVGRVSVIDQLGRLLSGGQGKTGLALKMDQLEFAQRLEERYVQRVEQILTPIVGLGRVRAQAVADIDFSVVERTEEVYAPDRAALRSEQYAGPGEAEPIASGVPGALTNAQPNDANDGEADPAPDADINQPAADAAAAEGDTGAKEAPARWTRNFELDKSVSRTQLPVGRLRRLSVAVVIDDRAAPPATGEAAEGEAADQPPSFKPEDIERLTALVRDAVGFDAERGDTVQVVNSAFLLEEMDATPWYEQSWLLGLGRLLMISLVTILALFVVVKPLLRELLKYYEARRTGQTQALAMSGGGQMAGGGYYLDGGLDESGLPMLTGEDGAMRLPGALAAQAGTPGGAIRAARQLATEDPRRSAHVLKRWLTEE